MAERQKTKFEEELEKLLKLKKQQEEQFNDPFTESIRSYPKLDSFGNVGDVYPSTAMPYDYDANRYKFYGNPNSSNNEDVTHVPFKREYKENYAGHEEYKPSVWPVLAKEGEPAMDDPGLILRSAAYSNKARRDRNMETAMGTARKALEDLRNTLSPEQHEREMRGVPAGHRAGLMNLYRPQYQAYMNEAFNAPDMVLNDRAAMASANTPEAEYAYNEAYAEGAKERLNALNIKRERIQKKLEELKAVRHLELTNDPMWAVAKLQYLNENDSTGLNNIMTRIQADIQRRFQEAENDKTRQVTKDQINAAKEKDKADKEEAIRKNLESKIDDMRYELTLYKRSKKNTDDQRNLRATYKALENAAKDANKDIKSLMDSDELTEIEAVVKPSRYNKTPEGSNATGTSEIAPNIQAFNDDINDLIKSDKTEDALNKAKAYYENTPDGLNSEEYTSLVKRINDNAAEGVKWKARKNKFDKDAAAALKEFNDEKNKSAWMMMNPTKVNKYLNIEYANPKDGKATVKNFSEARKWL